jgi:hypothetical protein
VRKSVRERIINSLVQVGIPRGGRGFLIHGGQIVTAAHCLPRWPTIGRRHTDFPGDIIIIPKLRSLRSRHRTIGQVTFLCPTQDVAVIAAPEPDWPGRGDPERGAWEDYDDMLENLEPLTIRREPLPLCKPVRVHLYTADGEWLTGELTLQRPGPMSSTCAVFSSPIGGGTSGSPIVDDDGLVVGAVSNPLEPTEGPSSFPRAENIPCQMPGYSRRVQPAPRRSSQ